MWESSDVLIFRCFDGSFGYEKHGSVRCGGSVSEVELAKECTKAVGGSGCGGGCGRRAEAGKLVGVLGAISA